MLTELYGSTPVFDLGLLEAGPLAAGDASDWTAAEGGMALSVEGSPVLLRVEMPGGIPPGDAGMIAPARPITRARGG